MSEFLQAIAQGVLIGSTYGLLALGIVLLYGVSGVVNFSHGDFISLGMFLGHHHITRDDGARHAGIQISDQTDDRAPVPDDRAINAWT